MTGVDVTGNTPMTVSSYRLGDDYALQVGKEFVVLSEADADKLGRFLLFNKAEGTDG